MPERIAFDPRKLAGDTHSLLYSILQPHQRKAVVRESFALFFINNKGEHKKIVDKSGNMLVETHRREWLDTLCSKLMKCYENESTLFPLQAKQLTRDRFMNRFNDEMSKGSWEGWRWNSSSLQYKRSNGVQGKAVKAEDLAKAEEAEKIERKKRLVDFEESQDQAKRTKRHKDDGNAGDA